MSTFVKELAMSVDVFAICGLIEDFQCFIFYFGFQTRLDIIFRFHFDRFGRALRNEDLSRIIHLHRIKTADLARFWDHFA